MNTNNDEQGEKNIQEVVAWMVKEKGIPEDERATEEERVRELLETKTRSEILRALPTEQLRELNELLDDEDFDEEKLDEIVESAGLKLEDLAEQALKELEAEYLGETEAEEEE